MVEPLFLRCVCTRILACVVPEMSLALVLRELEVVIVITQQPLYLTKLQRRDDDHQLERPFLTLPECSFLSSKTLASRLFRCAFASLLGWPGCIYLEFATWASWLPSHCSFLLLEGDTEELFISKQVSTTVTNSSPRNLNAAESPSGCFHCYREITDTILLLDSDGAG
ncbi:uncharacterized protein B0J16DRAFT_84065 [Fusarium flagelliforme]|uniref:uncharacterized protein n=1 Tax=Fusarium flagelliforme TaxID=2675880 RepID=UPI001E8DB21F|nr:uncharacterized protein B0J16DRAFT_84065 [Fusarium flagelliforme]KAH7193705.1 hypothetical protein B0J16DRAFT_84065 [Fusarium flagelliforme]